MTDSHEAIQAVKVHAIEPNPGHSIAPVVSAILAQNPTAEALGQLMALQERWEDREAKRAFIVAMNHLKADLPPVLAKNAKGHTNKYASLDAILSLVTPYLTENGFDVEWDPHSDEKMVTVTLELSHVGGYSKRSTMSAPPDTGPGRNAVQARGSTVAYLQRYLLTSMLGVTTGDMPDPDDARGKTQEDLERIDPQKNMELAGFIRGQKFMVEDAEGYVGRTADKWTAQDRLDLREWIKGKRDAKAGTAPKASPPPSFALDGEEYVTDDDAPKVGGRTR